MQIVKRKIDDLIPYAKNSRTHSPAQIAQIAASIAEFGWTNPLLLDGKNGIIAGHGRLKGAKKLRASGTPIPNWDDPNEVPTIDLEHMTPAQRKAYILADNRLALSAGWDDDLLSTEMGELFDIGFDLKLTGFDPDEIADMFGIDLEPQDEAAVADDAGPYKITLEFKTQDEQQAMLAELQERGVQCKTSRQS